MDVKEIKAIAFDIDGTLYSNARLYLRIAPFFLRHLFFFIRYNKVRKILHRTGPLPDFFEYQARLFADGTLMTSVQARNKIDEVVYHGLTPYFKDLRSYPYVYDSFLAFKKAGLKLAILSDFPPRQKGDIWGTLPLCDVVMGSEECGALKPSVYTFGVLAQKLGLPAESILYVGNSIRSDILGAHKAGMKTAYILPLWRKILRIPLKEADICFSNYRQLQKIVLK
ncbi:MAG: HAD family hydrolase [Treponemataceae bacterium]|nr:HAD family hydrolase [Treponemataceae bacterium]